MRGGPPSASAFYLLCLGWKKSVSTYICATKSLVLEHHPSTGYRMTEKWGWGLGPMRLLVAATFALVTCSECLPKLSRCICGEGLIVGFGLMSVNMHHINCCDSLSPTHP